MKYYIASLKSIHLIPKSYVTTMKVERDENIYQVGRQPKYLPVIFMAVLCNLQRIYKRLCTTHIVFYKLQPE